jgi:LPXTG-motif cell wall-anchored protein
MLSKNNWNEQFRKQEPKKQRFTIKKLTVGVASVLLGFTFMAGTTASANDTPVGDDEGADTNGTSTDQEQDKHVLRNQVVSNDTTTQAKSETEKSPISDEFISKVESSDLRGAANQQGETVNTSDREEGSATEADANQASTTQDKSANLAQDVRGAKETTAKTGNKLASAGTVTKEQVQQTFTNLTENAASMTEKQQQVAVKDAVSQFKQLSEADKASLLDANKEKQQKEQNVPAPTVTNTPVTFNDVKKKYADFEQNAASMTEEERLAAGQELRDMIKKLPMAQRMALTTGTYVADMGGNMYQKDGDTVTINGYYGLSRAILDKSIHHIIFNSDIDLSNMTARQADAVKNETGSDGKKPENGALWTDLGTAGVAANELAVGNHKVMESNYKFSEGTARDLTFDGNGHDFNMGKWYFGLYDTNFTGSNTPWNIKIINFNNLTTDTTSPFYMAGGINGVSSEHAAESTITYDGIKNLVVKDGSLIESGVKAVVKNTNITSTGSSIVLNGVDSATLQDVKVKSEASLMNNIKGDVTIDGLSAEITDGSFVNTAASVTAKNVSNLSVSGADAIANITGDVDIEGPAYDSAKNITTGLSATVTGGSFVNTAKSVTVKNASKLSVGEGKNAITSIEGDVNIEGFHADGDEANNGLAATVTGGALVYKAKGSVTAKNISSLTASGADAINYVDGNVNIENLHNAKLSDYSLITNVRGDVTIDGLSAAITKGSLVKTANSLTLKNVTDSSVSDADAITGISGSIALDTVNFKQNDHSFIDSTTSKVTFDGTNNIETNDSNLKYYTVHAGRVAFNTKSNTTVNMNHTGSPSGESSGVMIKTEEDDNGDEKSVNIAEGAKVTLNSESVDIRGIATKLTGSITDQASYGTVNVDGTLYENLANGNSNAIMAQNLIIGKTGYVNIQTAQDNIANGNGEWAWSSACYTHQSWHFAPIALGTGDQTIAAPAKNGMPSTLIDNGTLIVNRKVDNTFKGVKNAAFSPLISYGNASKGNKDNVFSFIVGEGAVLDLQDNSNNSFVTLSSPAAGNSLKWLNVDADKNDPTKNVSVWGLISMMGNTARDILQFNNPGYVNLQRTGHQRGSLIRLEGMSQNDAIIDGGKDGTPLAQWNMDNSTDTPDEAWYLQKLTSQAAGNDFFSNFLPAGMDVTKLWGNLDSKYWGKPFSASNGTAQLTPFDGNEYAYANGSYTGKSMAGVNASRLAQFTNDFSWWSPRRLAFGTKLVKEGKVDLKNESLYNPETQTIETNTSKKPDDFTVKDGIKDLKKYDGTATGTTVDKDAADDKGNKIVDWDKSSWGINWEYTKFTEDGKLRTPDANGSTELTGAEQNEYDALKNMIINPKTSSDGYLLKSDAEYPKLDEQGNVVKDKDGNPVMEMNGRTATIVYTDGTADFVNIPFKVEDSYGNKYTPTYPEQKGLNDQDQTVTPTIKDADNKEQTIADVISTDSNKPGFVITDKDSKFTIDPSTGVITIPKDSTPGEYNVPVTVTYKDGSQDTTTAKVTVDDAPKVNGIVAENGTIPAPSTAVTNLNNGKDSAQTGYPSSVEWKNGTPTLDENFKGTTDFPATVTYPDGTTTEVNIPVSVTGNSQEDGKTIYYGDQTSVEFSADAVDTHKTTGDNILDVNGHKFDTIIVKKGWNHDKKDYDKTITYKLDKKDGKNFVNTADSTDSFAADKITYTWQDGFKPNTNETSFKDKDGKVIKGNTLKDDQAQKTQQGESLPGNSRYRYDFSINDSTVASKLGLPSSYKSWVNAFYNFYTATPKEGTVEAVHGNENSLPAASSVVNTNDLTKEHNSEIDTINWVPGIVDFDKTGNQTGKVRITFKDKTHLDVEVPVNVKNNAADDNVATGQDITVPEGTEPTAKDAISNSGDLDKLSDPSKPDAKTTYEWKTTPDSTPGKHDATVVVTYPDGSKDEVQTHVTVNATPTVGGLTTDINKVPDLTDPEVAKKAVSNINNGQTTEQVGYPKSIEWKTKPDVTKAGLTTGEITVHYPSGDDQTVTVPVAVNDPQTDPNTHYEIDDKGHVFSIHVQNIVTHKTSDKGITLTPVVDWIHLSYYKGGQDYSKPFIFEKQSDGSYKMTIAGDVPEGQSVSDEQMKNIPADKIKVSWIENGQDLNIPGVTGHGMPSTLAGDKTTTDVYDIKTNTQGKDGYVYPEYPVTVDTSAVTNFPLFGQGPKVSTVFPGVTIYGASKNENAEAITVNGPDGFNQDSDTLKGLVDHTDIDKLGEQAVKSYTWGTKPTISNGKVTAGGTVRINFDDGTYLDIPVDADKIDYKSEASQYTPSYNPTNVQAGKSTTVDPTIKNGKGETVNVPEGTKYTAGTDTPTWATVDETTGKVTLTPGEDVNSGAYNVPVTVTYKDGSTETINAPVFVTDKNGDQTVVWGDNGAVVVTTDPAAVKAHETSGKTQVIDAKDAIKSIDAYKIGDDGKIATTPTTIDKSNVTASWTKDIDTTVDKASAAGKKIEGASVKVDLGDTANDVLGNASKTVTTNTFDITAAGAQAKDSTKVPVKIKLGSDLTDAQFTALVNNKIDGSQIASTAWQTKPTKTGDGTIRITFTDKNGNDATYLDVTIPKENMTVTGDDDAYTPTGKETTIKQGKPGDQVPDPKNSVDPDSITNVPTDTTYTWTTAPDQTKPGKQDVSVTITYPDKTTDTVTTTVTVNATPDVKPIRIDENTPTPDPTGAITNVNNGGDKPFPGYPTTVTWKDETPDTKTPGKTEVEVTVHYPSGEDQTVKVPVVITENPDIKPIVVTPGVTPDVTKTVTNLHPDGTNPGYPSTVTWQNPDDVPTKPGIYNPTVVITYPKVDGEDEPKTVVTTVPVVIPDTDQTVISNDKGVVIVTTQPVTSHKTSDKNAATDASVAIKSVETYKIENGKISATPSSTSKTGVTASWDVNTVDANSTATSTADHDVTITFGADSDAVKAGIAESGNTATKSVSVSLQGATKSTNTVDVTDPAAIKALTSDQLATLVNHADLDKLPAGSVTGYSWATEPSVTNGKVGDNGVVKISFNDGTSLNVKVDGSQFNYAGQASEFAPHYADTTLQQGETKTVANDGWTDDKKPAGEVTYALADNHPDWISIDSSTGVITYKPVLKQTESKDYTVPVTVTYGDGSTDTVNAKVTVTDKTTNVKPGDKGVTKDKYGDLFKDVTRTVNIEGQDQPTVQTVHFGRTGVYDETTGKFVDGQFGDWKILDGNQLTDQTTGNWAAVNVAKKGYTASAKDEKNNPVTLGESGLSAQDVNGDTPSTTITITYTKNADIPVKADDTHKAEMEITRTITFEGVPVGKQDTYKNQTQTVKFTRVDNDGNIGHKDPVTDVITYNPWTAVDGNDKWASVDAPTINGTDGSVYTPAITIDDKLATSIPEVTVSAGDSNKNDEGATPNSTVTVKYTETRTPITANENDPAAKSTKEVTRTIKYDVPEGQAAIADQVQKVEYTRADDKGNVGYIITNADGSKTTQMNAWRPADEKKTSFPGINEVNQFKGYDSYINNEKGKTVSSETVTVTDGVPQNGTDVTVSYQKQGDIPVKADDTHKSEMEITRTITFEGVPSDKQDTYKNQTQTVKFTRVDNDGNIGHKDPVTDVITYNPWRVAEGDGKWASVDASTINGTDGSVYTPAITIDDKSATSIPEVTVSAGTNDKDDKNTGATQPSVVKVVYTETTTPIKFDATQADMTKEVTRTITVDYPDSATDKTQPAVQTVKFSRVDAKGNAGYIVDGVKRMNDWHVDGDLTKATGTWAKYDAPSVKGYTANPTEVQETAVNADTSSTSVEIKYNRNDDQGIKMDKSNKDYYKTITRKITVNYPAGTQNATQPAPQTVTFTREDDKGNVGYIDAVTGEHKLNVWHVEGSTDQNGNWAKYDAPTLAGYTSGSAPEVTVTPDTKDATATVDYTANDQTVKINYVDNSDPANPKTIKTQTVTGKTGTSVTMSQDGHEGTTKFDVPEGWTIVPGKQLPATIPFNSDPKNNPDQTVYIEHKKDVTHGYDHKDDPKLYKKVTRTIKVKNISDDTEKSYPESLEFYRDATYDEVTKETTYGPWTSNMQGGTTSFTKTPIDSVPGYSIAMTGATADVEGDKTYVPAQSALDEKGNPISDFDIRITYTANEHTKKINFVDNSDKKTVVHTQTVTGKTGDTVTITTDKDTSKLEVPAGWTIVTPQNLPGTITFGPEDPADSTVYIEHKKDVTDGRNDKDNTDVYRHVTRTITVNIEGEKPQTVTQDLYFYRTKTVDEVKQDKGDSDAVSYGDWTSDMQDGSTSFQEFAIPDDAGYTMTISGGTTVKKDGKNYVAAQSGLTDKKEPVENVTVTVDYKKADQSFKINFVNNDNHDNVVSTQTVSGKLGDAVKLTVDGADGSTKLQVPEGWEIVDGNPTITATFGTKPLEDQTIYIQHKKTETDGRNDQNNTDVYRKVTRTIIMNVPNATTPGKETETLEFYRIKTHDEVTDTDSYSDWMSNIKGDKTTFDEFNVSKNTDGKAIAAGYIPSSETVTLTDKNGDKYVPSQSGLKDGKPVDNYTITINYNAQTGLTQKIEYVSVFEGDNNKVVGSQDVTGGKTGDHISFIMDGNATNGQFKLQLPEGYKLYENKYPSGFTFEPGSQPIQIKVTHDIQTTAGNTEGHHDSDIYREVTRTWTTTTAPGENPNQSDSQTLAFYRTKTVDLAKQAAGDKDAVQYSNWKSNMKNGETSFSEVDTKVPAGYTVTMTNAEPEVKDGKTYIPEQSGLKDGEPVESYTVVLTYMANEQSITVTYVDAEGNEIKNLDGSAIANSHYTLTGKTGDSVDTKIQANVPEKWQIVEGTLILPSVNVGSSQWKSMTIPVQHKTEQVQISKDDANTFRQVTENIYQTQQGADKAEIVETYTVSFQRSATKDLVTGNVNYGDWQVVLPDQTSGTKGDSYSFPEYSIQNIPAGYNTLVDGTQVDNNKVSAKTVKASDFDKTQNTVNRFITFAPQDGINQEIHFISDFKGDNNKQVGSQSVTGKTSSKGTLIAKGTPADGQFLLNVPDGWKLVDPNFTKDFTFAPGAQVIDVHVTHDTKTVDETNAPDGVDKTQFSKEITRTITANVPNADKPQDLSQHITLHRTGNYDEVQKKVTSYNDWSTGSFDAVTAPSVDGYTPSQASVAADNNVTDKYVDTPITITYTANNQSTTAKFVDDDANGKQVGTDITLSGKTDQTIDPSKSITIPDNYELAKDEKIPTSYKFGAKDNAAITIHLVHKHGTPADDEQDKDNGNKTVNELTHKDIKRTITITNPDGSTNDASQTVTLTRTANKDLVTGKITYGDWTTSSFAKVGIPQKSGYTRQVDGKNATEVPAVATVDSNYTDPKIKVTYVANESQQSFHFITEDGKDAVDKNGNKIPDVVVTGKTGDQKHGSDVTIPAGWKLVDPIQDFTIPATDTAINVKIKHGHITVNPDQPKNPTDPIDPKNPDGPKYPSGVSESDLNKSITQVVNETLPGQAKKQLDSQTLNFERTADIDEVTGEVTYGNWTAKTGSKNVFDSVNATGKDGYVAQVDGKDGSTVSAPSLTNDVITDWDNAKNIHEITYRAQNGLSQKIEYVSSFPGDNNKVVATQTVDGGQTGQTKQLITSGTAEDGQVLLNIPDGYKLDGDYTKSFTFAPNAQPIQIKVTHATKTVDKDHVPDGYTKDDFSKTIKRTITAKTPHEGDKDLSQTTTLYQTGTLDEKTGKVTFNNDWSTGSFDAVTAPSVDGYTPSQESVAADNNVTDKYVDTPITITYTANKQSINIIYQDKDGKEVGKQKVDGTTDQTVDVTAQVPTGWTLSQGQSVPETVTFKAKDNQDITVKVEHHKTTVQPTDPKNPGDPIDPKNPEGPKYPAGVTENDLNKTITRTITVTDPKTGEHKTTQTLSFQRTASVDDVDGSVTYGEWTPKTVGKDGFAEFTVPTVDGYTASQSKVDAKTPTNDEISNWTDPDTKITYTADDSHQTFHYVDKDGNDAGVPDAQVTGKTDEQKHGSDVPVPDGWELVTTPSDFTIPAPDKDTAINVAIKHGEITVNPNDPKKPGDKIPGTNDQHYPAGIDHDDLNKTISRTVTIVKPDGTKSTITQELSYQRNATVDKVTHEVTYGSWTPNDSALTKFEEVAAPEIKGYTADKIAPEVTPTNTQISNWVKADHDVTINYTAGDQSVEFKFVDDDKNGELVETITLAGNTGENKATNLSVPNGYELAKDETLPANYTFTDDNQAVTIHLVHATQPADKDHVPAGHDKSEFTKNITRTITVTTPDGTKINKSQTITLERTGTYDEATGDINWNPWSTGKFDKVTDIPTVDGYTPSQTEVPAVDNVTDKYVDTPVNITYTANDSHQTFHYVDKDGNDAGVPDVQVTGKTDEQKHGSDVPVPDGWELVGTPSDFTIPAPDKDTAINVAIKHGETTVSPNDPKKPGDKIPGTKDQHYPAGVDYDDLNKTISRTVTIVNPDGTQNTITQQLSYKRNAAIDNVTHEVTYGNWTPADPTQAKFAAVAAPEIKGYTADKTAPEVTPTNAEITDWTNHDVTINYNAGDQSVVFKFVDDTANGKLVETITLAGNTGDTKATGLAVPAGYELAADQTLPTNYTFTADNQPVTIHVVHTTTAADKDHVPAGYKTSDFAKELTRTITVTKPDGSKVDMSQTITITRTGAYDEVTKKVTFNPWTTGRFDKVTVPTIAGYTPSQAEVPAVDNVTDGYKDPQVEISYTKNPTQADQVTPKVQDIIVNEGETPDPKDGIENSADLDKLTDPQNPGAKTTYTWQDGKTPDTTKPGDTTAVIEVTYPDGSKDEVPVTIHVKDNTPAPSDADKYSPSYPAVVTMPGKTTTTDVQYPDGQHPTGKVTYTTDPATPDWINVDPSTGTITVTVPEGQSTDVITVPVTVTYPDNTAEHPSVDHPTVTIVVVSVKPSVTDPKTPTDVIDDPTKLPEGTNVEWTKGQTPDPTKKGDGQKTSVTVTIPGHDPIEIPTDVTYTKNPTQADQNTPKVQEIIVNEGETPDPKDGIANAGDLDKLTDPQNPDAKTTYTWKDGKTPDTTTPGDTTAVIEVTYPDGSKDEVPVTIHVKDNTPALSDADKNNPVGQVITVESGNLPDPADGIKNKDDLPAGTHCDWETTPDTTTPGDKTVTIVVTYPDGSQDKVSTTVHVNEPASPVDKVAPQVKPVTTSHGQVPTPADLITNKADLPAGTSYEWHDLAKVVQDVKVYGDHEEVVDVKYPDGSVTQVTVTITVPTPAADQDTTSEDSLPDTTDNTEVAVDTTNTGEQTSDNGQANATVTTTDTTVKGDSDGKDHAAAKKLPQTGNDASKTSAMLGLGMATLTSLFGLAKRKKKQDD